VVPHVEKKPTHERVGRLKKEESAMPPASFHRASKKLLMSRRTLMKAGFGVTAAGFLLRTATTPALAQKSYPALGTFPTGSSSNTIFVGGVMPLISLAV
jgi:hypothetical protein